MTAIYRGINRKLTKVPPYSPKGGPEVYWRFTMDKPIDEVDVVIVGQDPGHPDQSCGLAFSYPEGEISLRSAVYKIVEEVKRNFDGFSIPENRGDLSAWSQRGVVLMNASLTKVCSNYLTHTVCNN